jgi:hypothetical protein
MITTSSGAGRTTNGASSAPYTQISSERRERNSDQWNGC